VPNEDLSMLRMIVGIYTLGIAVVFGLLLFLRPTMPLLDAVFTALVWPYGVYHLIASKTDVTIKSGMLPVVLVGAHSMQARFRGIGQRAAAGLSSR
jgi:hypothetical protein